MKRPEGTLTFEYQNENLFNVNIPNIIIFDLTSGAHLFRLQRDNQLKINFQNYDECKAAYNKGYGIKFGELNIPADQLSRLKRFIHYRHRIIHISPSLGILNQGKVPPETPEFPNKELRNEVIACFDNFITELHNSTLNLKKEK